MMILILQAIIFAVALHQSICVFVSTVVHAGMFASGHFERMSFNATYGVTTNVTENSYRFVFYTQDVSDDKIYILG